MRVVYYSAHPDLPLAGHAGYSTHMRGMIAGLEANGASVVPVIAGKDNPATSTGPKTERSGLRPALRRSMGPFVWNALRDLRLIRADFDGATALQAALRSSPVDMVYERHTHLHRQGVSKAHEHGVPHVLEINSPPDERAAMGGRSPLDRLGKRFVLQSIEATDLAVFVSSALRDSYQELLGDEIGHAIVVANAVSEACLADEPTTANAHLSTVTIGFVGSLLEWHGIDLLINAFAEVHRLRPNTQLRIVGDGELRSAYEDLAADLDLGDAIRFVGRLPHSDALKEVASFDVGVMVRSNSYGSPVKLFEYAAKGCAIIAPDVAPAHEVLLAGKEALFVSPTEPSITEALLRLIDDPSLRRELGRAAKQRVASEYTWERAAAKVVTHLNNTRCVNG